MEHIGESILIPSALGAVDTLVLQTEHMILGWGFDGNLTKLHENLITIQSVLSDAENRKLRFTEQWLMKLKSVINGAENLMVELKYEAARRKIEVRNWMRNKVRDFFSLSNPLTFRLKMIHKVNDINLLIKEVREQANGSRLRPSEDNHDIVRSSTFIDDSEIMERDWDVCRLKDMLLGSGTDSEFDYGLPVIAVVGIPTVGKTALAQLVYNDSKVVKNFRANRKWICVSTGFKLERLLSEMVQFLTRVNGKRYLLVLDDVLNIEGDQWEQMMNALLRIDGSERSRIMVTTRSIEVVLTMRIPPFLIHQLSPLTEDRSWTMFRSIAFAAGGPRPTQSLIEIGRNFLPKCKGIPLAIKSVASLLYLSHDESAWMSIYNNENLSFVPNEPGVLEKFRLTFDELPSPSLKQCFAYCAVFPKGHNIKTDELIQLWTNLGYLHPNLERNLEMEDVGNYNCKVLMEKSLLESVEMDEYKNITSCKIPNDVHDLAVQIYEGYRLTLEPNGRKFHTVADHLSLDFCEEKGIDIPKGNVEMLTALFPQIGVNVNHTLAFGLFGDDVEKLPNSICKFLLLTYLDLSETSITKLPKFITKFYNLQTLKLPMHLIELPKQFHNLVSLRHFCMPNASQTRKLMPMKIGQLTCLQTLPFFVVGEGRDQRIKELESLTKLRGRLHVYDLQRVKGKEEAKQANISGKLCIQELGFHWDSNAALEQNTNTVNQEHVLDGLQPHSNIRGLILKNFGGQSFPSWMMSINGPLQNLVKIELMDCSLCEQVPSLGHLPCLEIIEMVGLGNLKHIDPGFYGYNDGQAGAFPALRKLTLDGMPMLKKWSLPDGTSRTEFFPCLKELYISDCPQLVAIPIHLFSIQEMTISSLSLSDVESAKTYHPSLTICSACKNSELLDPVLGDLLEKSSKPLRSLTIRGLNELSYLPINLWNLTSLEKLEIIECGGLISVIEDPKGFDGLTSLQQLSIKRCPKLTRLSEGLVPQTLVTLEIDSCPSLGQVELGSLTSLQNLMIKGCPGLVSCWKEKLLNTTSLQKLEIGAFSKELDYFPWPSTNAVVSAGNANVDSDIQPYASTSAFIAAAKQPQLFSFLDLRSLGLWGWEKLDRLPEVLQHLTSLTELSIHLFHSLEALPDWLANLSSLQSLELHNCKNLAVLPKQYLLQLRQLTIGNCPLLGKRCGKRTGAEWAKIAHIPSVKFLFSAEELTVVLPEVK